MRLLVIAAIAIALLFPACHAQTIVRQSTGTGQEQFFTQGEPLELYSIPGLGAGLADDSGGIAVVFVSPAANRPAEFKSVDLAEQDIIMMCNGKRTKTIADLRALIDPLNIGDEIKLAVRRGQDRMIVAFPKPDPEKYPKQQMMVMRNTGNAPGGDVANAPGQTAVQLNLGPGEGVALVLEAGLLLSDSDSGLFVQQQLPTMGAANHGPNIAVGALVKEIDGTPVSNVEAFNAVYEKTPEGKEFEITFSQKGETISGRWAKSKPLQVREMRQSE